MWSTIKYTVHYFFSLCCVSASRLSALIYYIVWTDQYTHTPAVPQCWPSVVDTGPALRHHWVSTPHCWWSLLVGISSCSADNRNGQWRIQQLPDGGGAPIFCKNFYTPQLALICSGGVRGHAPPENFEIWGLKWRILDHIVFLFLRPWTRGGGGAGCAPPLDPPLDTGADTECLTAFSILHH